MGCRLSVKDIDGDGVDEIVMENHFIKLVLKGGNFGGRMVSLIYKTGPINLTWFNSYYPDPRSGMFGDQLSSQIGYANTDYLHDQGINYKHEVISNLPEKISVRLFSKGFFDKAKDLEISKTITMYQNKSSVDIDYTLSYDSGLKNDYITTGFISRHVLRAGDIKNNNAFENVFLIPTDKEILSVPYVPHTSSGGKEIENLSKGWLAVLAESTSKSGGAGMAIKTDYRNLEKISYSFHKGKGEEPLIALFYPVLSLKNGQNFKTRIQLIPFNSMKSVTVVKEGVVGNIEFSKEKFEPGEDIKGMVQILASKNRKVIVDIGYRFYPDQKVKTVETKDVDLFADKVESLPFHLPYSEGKHYVCVVAIRDNSGKQLLVFEKPVFLKQGMPEYVLEPEEKKTIYKVAAAKTREMLEGPESYHENWANPYWSGPINVLLTTGVRTSRDVIELQQRLQIEYDYVYRHGGKLLNKYSIYLAGPGQRSEDEIQLLKRYLKQNHYDVMVLHDFLIKFFPEDVKNLIIEKVRRGMGILCIGPEPLDKSSLLKLLESVNLKHINAKKTDRNISNTTGKSHYLINNVPFEKFPLISCKCYVGEFGKGRIVFLSGGVDNLKIAAEYPRFETYFEQGLNPEYPYHEYSFMWLSRMVIWAAGKEPKVSLANLDIPNAPTIRGKDTSVKVIIENKIAADFRGNLHIKIRNNCYKTVHEKAMRCLIKGKCHEVVEIQFPSFLPRGHYTIDVFIRNRGERVVDFGSAAFEIENDLKIEQVEIEKDIYRNGESISGVVVIQNDSGTRKASIVEELIDTHGRVLQAKEKDVALSTGKNRIVFRFKPTETKSEVLTVTTEIRDLEGIVDSNCSYVFLKQDVDVSDLTLSTYYERGIRYASILETYKKMGVKGVGIAYNYKSLPLFLAKRNNLILAAFYPDRESLLRGQPLKLREGVPNEWDKPEVDSEYNIRTSGGNKHACIHNPAYMKGVRDRISERMKSYKGYCNPVAFGLQDEPTFQNVCYSRLSPTDEICYCRHTIEAFQKYLRCSYGTVEKLNCEWETNFKTWDEIVPPPARIARFKKNIAPWIDFRIFLCKDYAIAMVGMEKTLKEVNPESKGIVNILFEGVYAATMAYYLFGPDGLSAGECYPQTLDLVRSYSMDSKYRIMYRGYTAWGEYPDKLRYWAWKNLGYGSGRIGFYNGIELLYESSVSTPTYEPGRLAQFTKELSKEMGKTGIAKTILSCETEKPSVAILDSYPSRFAGYLEPEHWDKFGWATHPNLIRIKYNIFWRSYGEICSDLGYSWRLFNNEELDKGIDQNFRVLILPRVTCLSEKSYQTIRKFVKNGGLVIADYRLAEYDGHGKPVENSKILNLFGISREMVSFEKDPQRFRIKGNRYMKFDGMLEGVEREKGIKLIDGVALGRYEDGIPNTIIKKVGKGYFVYLNYTVKNYRAVENYSVKDLYTSNRIATRDLFDSIFSIVGLHTKGQVVDEDGKKVPGIFLQRYTEGKSKYFFVLRGEDSEEPNKAYLHLPEKLFVYRVGTHEYYGYTDKIEIEAEKCKGILIAAFPYSIKGLKLDCSEFVYQGQEMKYSFLLSSSKKSGMMENHVVRIEVINPDGREAEYWTKNIVIDKGGAYQGALPMALNEKPGKWKIKIIDTASGQQAEKVFEVRENQK